jgi:hypothetical protein
MKYSKIRLWSPVFIFFLTAACCLFVADFFLTEPTTKGAMPLLRLLAILAAVACLTALFNLSTCYYFAWKKKPITEWIIVNTVINREAKHKEYLAPQFVGKLYLKGLEEQLCLKEHTTAASFVWKMSVKMSLWLAG